MGALTLIAEPDGGEKQTMNVMSNIDFDRDRTPNTKSEAELLLDTRHRLQQARQIAQDSRDRLILYFIDMALLHVEEALAIHLDLGARSYKRI
jgi:hypothetical protein